MLLTQTSHVLARVRAKELHQKGLSDMEARALWVLEVIGRDATPGRIARRLGRTPHATSALLSRMEKAGLVRRAKDMDNKSMVRIITTEKGRATYGSAKQAEAIERVMAHLPKSQARRRQLRSDLETLRAAAYRELGYTTKTPRRNSSKEAAG